MDSTEALCLVVLPTDEALQPLWQYGIVAAFEDTPLAGRYTCRRGEDMAEAAPFLEGIHEKLRQATLMIADISAPDWNVGYHIGYARAADTSLIMIGKQGTSNPFSGAEFPFVEYPPQPTKDNLAEFIQHLTDAVCNISVGLTDTAVSELIEALRDDDDAVRRDAARQLGQVKAATAVDALLDCLDDTNWKVRGMASWALKEIGGDDVIHRLVQLLTDPTPYVRQSAAWTLGQIRDERVVGALLSHSDDSSPAVRESVAAAFKGRKAPEAVPMLMEALDDSESRIRSAAAEALGNQDDRRAIPALRSALEDSRPDVRAAAAEALGRLEDTGSTEQLIDAIADPWGPVREAAARALGKLEPDERSIQALGKAIDDDDEDVRMAAVQSLLSIGTKQARKLLADVVEDDTQPRMLRELAETGAEIDSQQ